MPQAFGYEVPEAQALATVRAVFNSAINFLDTAASYGDGESERRIGIVLRELGGLPPNFVLATKADCDPRTRDFSGEQTKRSIERSLQLLGVDRLHIVYLHDPEFATNTFEELMAPGGAVDVLLRYKEQGVIRHIGVAGGPVNLMMRYVETGAFEALITHNRYTLLNRAAQPLIDLAAQRGLAVLNAAVYNSGILAKGPYAYPRYVYKQASGAPLERARRMAAICQEYDVPLAAAALQFSLRDPRITSTIVGLDQPQQVAQTLDLAQHPIPAALWQRLDDVPFDTDDL
jgi:D-threo-aldose 1-dehydrogenase